MDVAMAEIDPNDRQKLTELAYQYEAVQQELTTLLRSGLKQVNASKTMHSANKMVGLLITCLKMGQCRHFGFRIRLCKIFVVCSL